MRTRRVRGRAPAAGAAAASELVIDERGWAVPMNRCPSPNFDPRPEGERIFLVVIHNISLPAGRFGTGCVHKLFTNTLDPGADPSFAPLRDLRVSAHFLVERNGRATQFVSCRERAWHAGVSSFRGRERCNDFSIGIELEGSDHVAFERRQYLTLNRLLRALARRFPITDIAGHSDIAPGRKTDPGPYFDWTRLRLERDRI